MKNLNENIIKLISLCSSINHYKHIRVLTAILQFSIVYLNSSRMFILYKETSIYHIILYVQFNILKIKHQKLLGTHIVKSEELTIMGADIRRLFSF